LSSDASALLTALDIVEPIVAIGTALGGANALHFAATFPERTLAAIATSPATGVSPSGRQGVLDLADFLEANGARAVVDRILDRSYPTSLRTHPERYFATRARRCTPDARSFAMAMRVLVELSLDETFPRINCPVLLLAGRMDPDRPPDVVRSVADRIANAQMRTLDSGHFMAIQTPELVADEIDRFLDAKRDVDNMEM
jgi:3-oxoadipate enol-lactonase